MKKNEIWSFKNLDEYFDPKFGLVYKDFGNNAFEIILCSTDYHHLSIEDIVIATNHSDLQYSLVVHSDMIFPMFKSDNKFNKQIGSVSNNALSQINTLRGDAVEDSKTKIIFNIGGPIFYKSDKRYMMKLNNLKFVDYYSKNSFEKLIFNIPDNVVPFISFKSDKSMFDEISVQKGREKADLISRQLLALHDRKLSLDNYLHKSFDDELSFLSLDIDSIEKDIVSLAVA